ncbi:MAG TPA: PPC domain-containing protein, partial [Isosphaeraceae bacterium]|nr:PPC domain-containing protein [Isosphaeraceae bacterium]
MLRRACLCALARLILQGRVAAKAPVLERLFPAGACRGSEGELTATGTFEHSPERCWVSGEGVLIEATPEKGRLRFKVESNAAPGLRWVRLHDDEGASALSPFIVGTLPELLEVEPNDDPRQPQTLEYACATVNGRLEKAGDVDGYAVWLERGQTLVASMEAHRHLGSPMDAVLQVVSEAGFVLAQNDDDVEFDPQLVFVAPADGTYIVRTFAFPATPNSTIAFAGGAAFVYRLTLTTGGFVDHVLPLALERSKPGPVELFGWNLPEQARRVELCPDPLAAMTVVSHPLVANTAEIRWVEHTSIREQEPNGPDQPQEIALPLAVSGV